MNAALMIKETENRAKEEADKKAKNILSLAITALCCRPCC